MKVGLFFGSFNPIHTGHMIIASLAHQMSDIDQVWFVVSPHNPFKKRSNLLPEFDRLDMVRAAIYEDFNLQASDIEFHLTKPSYTIHTLIHLEEKHPTYQFRLIVGEDNLAHFPKWKQSDQILNEFGLITYPRPNAKRSELHHHPQVEMIEAPKIDISATLIRKMVKDGKSIRYLVPDPVCEIISSRKYFLY
jgi:nicotinate-nucleotide adenylyltransferase